MPIEVSVKADFSGLERALLDMSKELGQKAAATAVARTAARARLDMREQLPNIFDRPTPFTVNSVRFAADPDARSASLFISEDGPKGTSPATYLRAEIMGGPRRDKRSERALIMAGIMAPDQQMVPGEGAPLDAYGNVRRGALTQILSRINAFGEQGYAANATETTRRRLRRRKLAHRQTGTDYFVGKNRDGRAGAVYQVIGRHNIRPVLIFTDRKAHYGKRFDFVGLAHKSFGMLWPKEMRRAFYETMEALGLKSK